MGKYFHFLRTQIFPLTWRMIGLALLFVGWVALLHFPWDWIVPSVAILEAIAICIVLLTEWSARKVNGAAGWMIFGFLMGHAWLFVAALALRALIFVVEIL